MWILAAALALVAVGVVGVVSLTSTESTRTTSTTSTTSPSTTLAPTTTVPPTTTVAPTTTAAPTTTVPPTTGQPPSNPIPSFIRSGPSNRPFVAITIDDLFGASATNQLAQALDYAEARHVHLTLFPTGGALQQALRNGQQEVWRRAVRDGDEIGNHTFTHADLTKLSDQQIRDELTRTQDMLNRVLGPGFDYRMRLMRPPGGAGGFVAGGDPRIMRVVTSLGYSMVMWTIDSNNTAGFDSYVAKIMGSSGARNGSIILIHFTTFSAANVATLIDRLRAEKRLEPTTVSGLFTG